MARKLIAIGIVIAFPVMAQQFHIDHITVAGKSVEEMQKALRAVGVESEYGGPHSNHATEMALTSFPDGSYLELIAIQPQADPKALAGHEGRNCLGGSSRGSCRGGGAAAQSRRLRERAQEERAQASRRSATGMGDRADRPG